MTGVRWERLAPLTGAVAIVLIVVGVVVVGGSTPDVKDPAAKVFAFYAKHRSSQENASFIVAISAAVMLFFVVTLWHRLRAQSTNARLPLVSLAGGIVAVGGMLMVAALHLALAESGKYGDATVAQTLNIVDANSFLPLSSGIGVMVLAAGASAARSRVLPKWLGLVGAVIGVASFTPVGFPAFLLCLLWILGTSVLLAVRAPSADAVVPGQATGGVVPARPMASA